MKIYKVQGEQEIEALEFEKRLVDLTNEYDPTLTIGAMLKHIASFFIIVQADKGEFIGNCAEIYDRQVISYGKYLEKLERDEIDKKSEFDEKENLEGK